MAHTCSMSHPLPSRNNFPFLDAFRHIYQSLDLKAELANAHTLADNLKIDKLKVTDLFERFENLLECVIAFAYLFDSLFECTKDIYQAARGYDPTISNIEALIYQVARGYKLIDQGWRFMDGDDVDDDVDVSIPHNRRIHYNLNITHQSPKDYNGRSLDDFTGNNRTKCLFRKLGLPRKIVKKLKEMVEAIYDLMNDYYREFSNLCKAFGLEIWTVIDDCHRKNFLNLGLERTLDMSCGMQRSDLIAQYACTGGGVEKYKKFKEEWERTPTLENEANLQLQKRENNEWKVTGR